MDGEKITIACLDNRGPNRERATVVSPRGKPGPESREELADIQRRKAL